MTKKDYELIADALNQERKAYMLMYKVATEADNDRVAAKKYKERIWQTENCALALALAFEKDNARFDRKKFTLAVYKD